METNSNFNHYGKLRKGIYWDNLLCLKIKAQFYDH